MSTDYDALFRTTPDALGPPTPELVRAFERHLAPAARVLDLGCGQGRDALFLARLGHDVVAVDAAPHGIAALKQAAARDGLPVEPIVADITTYAPSGRFDLLLFDRILHMLSEADRHRVLRRLVPLLAPGGLVLIADEPRHRRDYRACLADIGTWETLKDTRGFVFLRRT